MRIAPRLKGDTPSKYSFDFVSFYASPGERLAHPLAGEVIAGDEWATVAPR
jgi:hypothetical protein